MQRNLSPAPVMISVPCLALAGPASGQDPKQSKTLNVDAKKIVVASTAKNYQKLARWSARYSIG